MRGALDRRRPRAGAGRARHSDRASETQRRMAYKLSSLALQYPDDELLALRQELLDSAAALGRSPAALRLGSFTGWWSQEPRLALRQHYVETFDMSKRCSLYLTYYTAGERRDRGLALVRLRKLYRAAGLPMASGELPDYLPVMLEFAAAAPAHYGEVPLREHRAALELLRAALGERSTPYAHVLDALCATLGEPSALQRAKAALLAEQGPPLELVGLEPGGMPPTAMPRAMMPATGMPAPVMSPKAGAARA
ncbi:MAG TPA: nitrate reductase molybdenum cofactor assembly chaperone [Solirubrobacteraceae bacterium]|nr:nitrate reductase molybdenum cofactor assembly chaperone [Solirubrobacteraceae bacterium]